MKTPDCLVVIPARYASTRFPGKVLERLGGRTVLEWVYRAAEAARIGPVLVATDSRLVVEAAAGFGAKAVLTPAALPSGTDRVYAAAKSSRAAFVVNVQADMPFVKPRTLRASLDILRRHPGAHIGTAVMPLKDAGRAEDPNVVKAAISPQGRALYFSRSPVPYQGLRNGAGSLFYQHLGIYAFRGPALRLFVGLKASPLEKAERLEQLRALEAGMEIRAAVVQDSPIAIDVPADIRAAREILSRGRR